MTYEVRTRGNPRDYTDAIRGVVESVDKFCRWEWVFGPRKRCLSAMEMELFTELADRSEPLEMLQGRLGLHRRVGAGFSRCAGGAEISRTP
jgi:hypothetical protein